MPDNPPPKGSPPSSWQGNVSAADMANDTVRATSPALRPSLEPPRVRGSGRHGSTAHDNLITAAREHPPSAMPPPPGGWAAQPYMPPPPPPGPPASQGSYGYPPQLSHDAHPPPPPGAYPPPPPQGSYGYTPPPSHGAHPPPPPGAYPQPPPHQQQSYAGMESGGSVSHQPSYCGAGSDGSMRNLPSYAVQDCGGSQLEQQGYAGAGSGGSLHQQQSHVDAASYGGGYGGAGAYTPQQSNIRAASAEYGVPPTVPPSSQPVMTPHASASTVTGSPESLSVRSGMVRINLELHGTDLAKMDRFGKSDPYVIISRLGGSVAHEVHRTECIKKNLNPKWASFSFVYSAGAGEQKADARFEFRVMDWDQYKSDDEIGTAVATLEELEKGPLLALYHSKKRDKKNPKKMGQLVVVKCKGDHLYTQTESPGM